jgi:hypothetical protein
MPFPPEIKEEALSRSRRRCCICLKFKGVKIEVHHIKPEAASHDNSLANAIPLCFDCHSDAGHYNSRHPKGNRYTLGELRKHRDRLWKLVAEGKVLPEGNLDSRFLELLTRAFDRAAFKTPFRQEGRMESFERAIDDTLLAMNTGVLRTRDGHVIADIGFGKTSLANDDWRKGLGRVEKMLYNLRSFVATALADGNLKCCHERCYCGSDSTIESLDVQRAEIVDTVNAILISAGFQAIENPLNRKAPKRVPRSPREDGTRPKRH